MRLTKPLLFLLCLLPFLQLLLAAFGVAGLRLGANPVETVMDAAGIWTLRLLLLTLAVTPARFFTGWAWLVRYRRMLGLFAFFYLVVHLATYIFLDLAMDWAHLFEDILERPFITIGFTAFVLLIPLAVTSTRGWMRRLGRRWQKLHRLVYFAAILGVWHFYWQVKLDTAEALVYALLLAALLGFRIWRWNVKRQA